jgi:hypothetical protein
MNSRNSASLVFRTSQDRCFREFDAGSSDTSRLTYLPATFEFFALGTSLELSASLAAFAFYAVIDGTENPIVQ